MAQTTAELLAEYLVRSGVKRIFAYPGDPIIGFMEAARVGGIEVTLASREGTAGFMAEGSAMATGTMGVCLSTLGPGSTALVNCVAAANLDRVPMLAISGQIDTAREPFFTHQVVDHTALFTPITKWAGTLRPGSAATIIRKAIRTATAERPGAVHLTGNSDVFQAPVEEKPVELPPTGPVRGGYGVTSVDGLTPDRMIATARRPVFVAGIGAVRAGASSSLRSLAELAGIPVVVAPMAKGIIDERSPMYAGTLDMACNKLVWNFIDSSDLVIAVGFDAVELISPWAVAQPVLSIDATPNTDQIYASPCEVVGDITAALDDLGSSWSGEQRWTETEIASHRAALRDAYFAGRIGGSLNPTDVVETVRDWAGDDAQATCDVGSHKLLVGQGWQATTPRTVLMTNGLSSMGFGLPAAIAAQLNDPARKVVAVVGDGGFAMVQSELKTAASLGLPITVVVLADNSLNRIELKQLTLGVPSTATRIENPDLVKLAEAMGVAGARATSVAELETALSSKSSTEPLLIEARIDPAQYLSQF